MAYFRKKVSGYGRRRAVKKAPTNRKGVVRRALKKFRDHHIKAVVKKVLGTQVETKIQQDAGSLTLRTVQPTMTQTQFDAMCFMCTPQGAFIGAITQPYPVIGNGIGQNQRIGDEIKIKAQYINYIVNARPYNASTNPSPKANIVQVYVVQPKTGQKLGLTCGNISASNIGNWFENQADSDSGMAGNVFDTIRKVDRDNYRVIAFRQHKIGWSGSLNTTDQVTTLQNNDFAQYATGRIKIPGYTWKVDRLEGIQKVPIYLFAQVMAADGSIYPLTTLAVEMKFNSTIYYTDI